MAAEKTIERINHVSSEQACAAVTEFLLDHVGHLLGVGDPHVMVSAMRTVWIVPVQLSYLHTGVLGTVGVVAVDEELGQVVAWTPISDMKEASRRLRALHEPRISEQFQSAMNAPEPSSIT